MLDRMAVGCAVESWQLTVGAGPGRANSKINVEFVGSGKVIDSATGITMPAATVEKLLPSASLPHWFDAHWSLPVQTLKSSQLPVA